MKVIKHRSSNLPAGKTPMYYARKRRKLSQEALAELVGLSKSNICRIESGDQVPSLEAAEKIAACLKLTELHIFYPERYNKGEK